MSDPLFDPLPEVLAEFGEPGASASPVLTPPPPAARPPARPPASSPPSPPVTPPVPVAFTPAPRVVPDGTRPKPLQAGPNPSAADLADLRDGLAGMRTDLRQVPEQVGQAIAGTVLHSVSVALSDVRRPLESMGLITEQLGAVLGRLDAVAGLREQVTLLDGVPQAIEGSRAQMNRELGGLASDLAALLTRVTGIDGRLADAAASLENAGHTMTEVERRLASLDSAVVEVSSSAATAADNLRAAIHDEVGKVVRDQLRDLVRDGVYDGVSGSLDDNLQVTITQAVATAQAEIEIRLRAHVDDAVMNLAEVLMRHQANLVRQASQVAAPAKKATKRAAGPKPKAPRAQDERSADDEPVEPVEAVEPVEVLAVPGDVAAQSPDEANEYPAEDAAEPDKLDELAELTELAELDDLAKHDDGADLDRLITRMPAAETLADAVASAVKRAGLGIGSGFEVPPPDPGAPGVEDILASWVEPANQPAPKAEKGGAQSPPSRRRRLLGRGRY